MNTQYCVNLNNEYDFRAYCTQKSIEAFDAAIVQGCFPSRFTLLTLLVSEIITDPFYLTIKINEISFHIFHILSTQFEQQKSLNLQSFSNIAALITIQFWIPFICTAIRICAITSGLLVPRWALQGWRYAEYGEHLSYSIWSNNFKEFGGKHLDISVYEEIEPSNAIFYLGNNQTHLYLDNINDGSAINLEVITKFAELLHTIAVNDPKCFEELIDHDFLLGSDADDKHKTPTKKYRIKNKSYFRSDEEIKQILSNFKSELTDDELIDIEELDELRLGEILKNLSMKELKKLFSNFYFNLHTAFEKNDIQRLNQKEMFGYFTQLKDLFSLQFHFGRVHFFQNTNSFYCYSPD